MKVLIVVDMQNDFIDGSLAVPFAQFTIPFINERIKSGEYHNIIYTRDWHIGNHPSFASQHGVEPFTMVNGEIKFPDHCVLNTHGAEITSKLEIGDNPLIIDKGIYNEEFAANFDPALIHGYDVEIVGLALDYCVKATALKCYNIAKSITILTEGVRGVDPEKSRETINTLRSIGVNIV
jgi:nicotinamidase/pyrazinamidase